jgi:DNA-binding NarL/FixJ family response regulator
MFRTIIKTMLRSLLRQRSHWKVYEAADGKAAVDCIREIKPDVVVMDIVMPEMSGIEAIYQMRRLAPETRVILMSSDFTPEEGCSSDSAIWRWEFHRKIGNWQKVGLYDQPHVAH